MLILADFELYIPFLCLLVVLQSQKENEEIHVINKMLDV